MGTHTHDPAREQDLDHTTARRRWRAPAALLLLIVILIAGCGSADGDSASKSTTATDPDTAVSSDDDTAGGGTSGAGGAAGSGGVTAGAIVPASLQTQISNVGGKDGAGLPVPSNIRCTMSIPAQCAAELTCPVAEGADPWHADACVYLAAHRDELFQPLRGDQACAEIYGGPEVAKLSGTVDGEQVSVTLSRTNGCEIARYDLHAPLWGTPVGDDPKPTSHDDPASAIG